MAPPELKINVGDLDAGGKRFAFPLRAAWIRGILEDHEATPAGPDGELDVRASRSGTDVVIHGTLKAELTVPCARCLDRVPLHIDQTLSLLFVPGKVTPPPVARETLAQPAKAEKKAGDSPNGKKKRAEPEEYELSAEEADTLPYDGEIVVLDDVVRDELILETPISPLCSEDCAGMSRPPGGQPDQAEGTQPKKTAKKNSSSANGDEAEAPPGIDPRLLPLLRLKNRAD